MTATKAVNTPKQIAQLFQVGAGLSTADALAAAKQFLAHVSLHAQGVPHDFAAHRARWMTDPAFFAELIEDAAAQAIAEEGVEAAA